ncbi:MAG: radical SAM protein [Deltaproteobacteria bacterium]|jgi:MoaA/NifB/PqqE/SkfB family radical SAM enzyme|nr:radical SAM protein [Deltaproteobacteria bacterium]
MKKFFHLAGWFLKARFLGRQAPLQTVLFINDECDLACLHCNIHNKKNPRTKSYQTIREELEYSHALGSRFVDFEGGEPFLWREGDRRFDDLVGLAREVGFYSATVTTNAQRPFPGCKADSVWVSLDGLGGHHDRVRGRGAFERLVKNVETCGHPRVSANMVVNSLNYPSVAETIEFVAKNPFLKSISINFHTPFAGTEKLFLDWPARREVIDLVIGLKKKGRPVMNSVSGLRLMKGTEYVKRCWVTNFIMPDGTRLPECQGRVSRVCDRCGFCMAGEMNSVFSFKPDTILAGLSLRVGS